MYFTKTLLTISNNIYIYKTAIKTKVANFIKLKKGLIMRFYSF